MADIEIERSHRLGLTQLKERLGGLEEKLLDRYGVKLTWRGNEAEVRGTGVSGTLSVDEAQVAVNLKLGLLMRPLAGKIREAMEKQIDRALV